MVNGFCCNGEQNLLVRGDNGSLAGNVASLAKVDDFCEWMYLWKTILGKIGLTKVNIIVLV